MATAQSMRFAATPLVSEETVELVRAQMADVTRDSAITAFSGLTGYELEAPAKVINPVITPLVNMIPRKQGGGNDFCHWKAITSFGEQNVLGTLNGNAVPSAVAYTIAQMSNPYNTIALSNSVNFQAQWRGRSLEGDVRARRVAELLYALKMREESWIITASQKLMSPAAPLLATATTGGSVAAATNWVQVTAVNANGESLPGAAASIVTTGTTSTITIVIFTVPNASYYNVYIGTGATQPAAAAMWLQSSVSGVSHAPQPTLNSAISLLQANGSAGGGSTISGRTFGPTITVTLTAALLTSGTSAPTTNTAATDKDTNGNLLMWDGLMAQAINNTSTANGLTLGAQVAQPADTTHGVLALSDLNNLLMNAYVQAGADPDIIVLNPVTHNKLTNLVVASGQTRYVVEANQPDASGRLVAQYRVTHFLNQATGKEVPIVPDLYCPLDSILAIPLTIPYPVPEVSDGNALEIETNREYWGVDFAVTNSSYTFADYVDEALKVYFLGGLCLLRGIQPAI